MNQSNVIFGALAVAFIVFVTARGSLPVYLSVLFGGSGGSGGASGEAPKSPIAAMGDEKALGFSLFGKELFSFKNNQLPGLGGLFN